MCVVAAIAACNPGADCACGLLDLGPGADSSTDSGSGADSAAGRDSGSGSDTDSGTETDSGPPPFSPAAMLAALGDCVAIGGDYATDVGEAANIEVCQTDGAVWWTSDMDIDCDGGREASCMVDPSYQAETSASDPSGDPIDANTVPFIVVPVPSTRFRAADHGIALGQYGLVIYEGRYAFATFADSGPSSIIGEGSYALAEVLGIPSSPISGGVDSGVTFILFPGAANRSRNIPDIAATDAASSVLAHNFLSSH
jgi:hypothetical protein